MHFSVWHGYIFCPLGVFGGWLCWWSALFWCAVFQWWQAARHSRHKRYELQHWEPEGKHHPPYRHPHTHSVRTACLSRTLFCSLVPPFSYLPSSQLLLWYNTCLLWQALHLLSCFQNFQPLPTLQNLFSEMSPCPFSIRGSLSCPLWDSCGLWRFNKSDTLSRLNVGVIDNVPSPAVSSRAKHQIMQTFFSDKEKWM